MADPAGMEAMMEGMKKNFAMIIPQTVIMSWITFFFSGFVLIKLPFPLTLRFKAMLQRDVLTQDMDVTWVSSLSWYFLNLFGLRSIFTLILGEENAADGMRDMQQMQMLGAPQPMAQPQDVNKTFLSEKEFLELSVHEYALEGVEERVLGRYGIRTQVAGEGKKKV
ncbi:ER membrane complex subunit 3 [Quaeritorhiza haematococci]|nr:ER membrane complex subunit 3 [Quaeritorhiza haematococci]